MRGNSAGVYWREIQNRYLGYNISIQVSIGTNVVLKGLLLKLEITFYLKKKKGMPNSQRYLLKMYN